MNKINQIIGKVLIWRVKHISQKHFILLLSLLVGIFSGLAAVTLKNAVHHTHHFLTENFSLDKGNYLFLAYPMIGILITILIIKFFVKDSLGHGVTKILYAISKKGGHIKSHNNYSSIITSTFTIGFGGSVGAEAPIVLTGASIGSSLGRLFRMNYKTIILLMGCGAAGAIAGIFKAPIAGLVFTLEVLMLDLTMASIVPLLISAITASTIAYFFLGKGAEFAFTLEAPFVLNNIPYYLLLGILAGFISLYFTRGIMNTEKQFGKMKNPFSKWIVGGLALSLLIFLFPPLYGEGYNTIIALLNGNSQEVMGESFFYVWHDNTWALISFLVLLIIFKVFATAATTGSGGIGGIFAPTLFMGGVTGYLFAKLMETLGLAELPSSHFTLVGMAGMMAGVMHAPLTAIFLIAEITNGYGLFIPLMITSTIAYLTIMYFEPHSLYTKRLAQKGELITHHKDKAVLTLMRLEKVLETDFKCIYPEMTLGELVKVISTSKRNIFPVINHKDELCGIVLLDDIREIMFNNELYNETTVEELMSIPPAMIEIDENMDRVMRKFEDTSAWNLPVVKDGKYLGFVSKSKIFSVYRRVLIHYSDD
ncbi:chloride channel protein [Carboxylicivirga mesophila]|uniref:Chloride channel protein n=1 Tax=Carboxylicivirga mesophila TaxID=1166478 RepID=A0ABS5K9G3_9BACT|nr:chloride channel protein [Carboxylicivirga mesophila]MBS2211156.1 chloride channel protein [Carboxylicivirga mesophila]